MSSKIRITIKGSNNVLNVPLDFSASSAKERILGKVDELKEQEQLVNSAQIYIGDKLLGTYLAEWDLKSDPISKKDKWIWDSSFSGE